mmetsp:Transcript_14406/g.13886  ORF Transcript_14406/g.13886 Transcript_14406/m.13886 type:complete len:111 (+) Transcript_14406:411-743(+)
MIITTVLLFGSYCINSKKDYLFDIWNNLISENLKIKLFGDCHNLPMEMDGWFPRDNHAEFSACREFQNNIYLVKSILFILALILLNILKLTFAVGLIMYAYKIFQPHLLK